MSPTLLKGPPEVLPTRPDATVDLQTDEGVALMGGQWRYSDARIVEREFVGVGADLGPSGPPNRTYDVEPHAQSTDFDDSGWIALDPAATRDRLSTGKVCFNWYRIGITIPDRVGDLDPTGSTAVLEIVVDDYAEVWVNGQLPLALGRSGGQAVAGFNAPNRIVLGRDIQPGQRFEIAVFGINGPISVAPENYIWIRSASLDFFSPERARVYERVHAEIERADPDIDAIVPSDAEVQRVATGFEFTEGPVWSSLEGALLFSSPNTNVIYRWGSDTGAVEVFRTKSGYAGFDIGRYTQPGSNGLTFDPQGRLLVCEHGNRRVVRIEKRGNVSVVADGYDGKRLNSPNDIVCSSGGVAFFTDPPFGLPATSDDPKKELSFSGVYRVEDGNVGLIDSQLEGPNGIALSPDERYLYVGNWDPDSKVIIRYELDDSMNVIERSTFFDMTAAEGDDAIDGIKVDRSGNLYVCGPSGIWLLSAGGRHLGTIRLPESPHNLAWGDADGRTLYITAMTSIYRIQLNVEGMRP